MKRGNQKKEIDLLKNLKNNILPSFDSKPNSWTEGIINKQVDVLTQVLSMEKETIDLIEQELNE